MLELEITNDVVEIHVRGKLTGDDYERLIPKLERAADEKGPLRLIVDLHDFRGWTPEGLWKDIKFDVTHQDDMDRIAIVGEKPMEKWGTKLSKPFFKADMRFFTRDEADDARQWVSRR